MSREDEIRERLEAATPGPWTLVGRGVDAGDEAILYPDGFDLVPTRTNATLIANAPTDIAYLLDRIKELEAEK